MRIKKVFMVVLVASMVALLLQAGYSAIANDGSQSILSNVVTVVYDKIKGTTTTTTEKSADKGTEIKYKNKRDIDIKSVALSVYEDDAIRNSNATDLEKDATNYKKLIAELEIPLQYRDEILKDIKKYNEAKKVYEAFSFLYENYGTIGEMDELLNANDIETAMADYVAKRQNSNPRDYNPNELELLTQLPNITYSDLAMAEMLSSKGYDTFDFFVKKRSSGLPWRSIKLTIGVINLEEEFPRTSVNGDQVEQYMKDTGLQKDTVIQALVLSNRHDLDEQDVLKEFKAGKKKTNVLAKVLKQKFE